MALLARALQLVKVGGRVVYSTCSLNPIENEAVIMEIWRKSGGAVQLVDSSRKFPGLLRDKGLVTWVVTDFSNQPLPKRTITSDESSLFPPTLEEACDSHIDYAMRFFPHRQNRGGFFICVLEKTEELPRLFDECFTSSLEKLSGLVKCEQQ